MNQLLYIGYLGFYLLTDWIPLNQIWLFTLMIAGAIAVIWFGIYFPASS